MSKQLLLGTIAGPMKADRRPVSLIGGGAWILKQNKLTFAEVAKTVVKDSSILSEAIISVVQPREGIERV